MNESLKNILINMGVASQRTGSYYRLMDFQLEELYERTIRDCTDILDMYSRANEDDEDVSEFIERMKSELLDHFSLLPKIKPCPFCNKFLDATEGDVLHSTPPISGDRRVWTLNCPTSIGGCGASILGDTRDDVVSKWNRRK